MASSINFYVGWTQISYFQSQFLNCTPKRHYLKCMFKIKLIFYLSFSRRFLLITKLTGLLGFRRIFDPQIPSPFTPYQATSPVIFFFFTIDLSPPLHNLCSHPCISSPCLLPELLHSFPNLFPFI